MNGFVTFTDDELVSEASDIESKSESNEPSVDTTLCIEHATSFCTSPRDGKLGETRTSTAAVLVLA